MIRRSYKQHKAGRLFASTALAATLAMGTCAWPVTALADDGGTDDADSLQQRVEQTAQEYNDASQRVDDLHQQMSDNQARIDEINSLLPAQKESAAQAVKSMYVMQNESAGLLQMLLGSENINEFLQSLEYLNHVQSRNTAQLQQLKDMRDALSQAEDDLQSQTQEAEQARDQAAQAQADAQAAREEAQKRAAEEAQRQLEQAQAQAAQQAAQQAQDQQQASQQQGVDSGNSDAVAAAAADDSAADTTPTQTVSDVDWSGSKQQFVAEWGPRIDAFLSSYGSPMAGQGSLFASAAWDNGVDPRWSPAISIVESSGGIYCFEPYNAWGWGDESFGSWEQAIPVHVAYLAGTYGATLTYAAAQKYCPPNADFWYNRCVSLMDEMGSY